MKTKNTKQRVIHGSAIKHSAINIVVPNTIQEKMAAIVNLSQAVLELSKAVNGVNLQATISNNVIHGAQTGIAIRS